MSFQSIKPKCENIEKEAGCIQATLCILGDKWSPLLVGQLVSSSMKFSELEKMLTGISPRTLSARLDKLLDEDIIIKESYSDHPPRFRYSLTKKGRELQIILSDMAIWGEKYSS